MKGKYREPLIVAAPGLLICPTSFYWKWGFYGLTATTMIMYQIALCIE